MILRYLQVFCVLQYSTLPAAPTTAPNSGSALTTAAPTAPAPPPSNACSPVVPPQAASPAQVATAHKNFENRMLSAPFGLLASLAADGVSGRCYAITTPRILKFAQYFAAFCKLSAKRKLRTGLCGEHKPARRRKGYGIVGACATQAKLCRTAQTDCMLQFRAPTGDCFQLGFRLKPAHREKSRAVLRLCLFFPDRLYCPDLASHFCYKARLRSEFAVSAHHALLHLRGKFFHSATKT